MTQQHSRKKIIYFSIIIGLLLIATSISLVFIKIKGMHMPTPKTPAVEVTPVVEKEWQASIRSTGSLNAFQSTVLKSEVAGRIVNLYFQPGDDIKQGQLLVQIENSNQTGQLHTATAQLDLNKLNYERYQKLLKSATVSKSEYDTARNNYEMSVGSTEQAQSAFDKTRVIAPFNGRIGLTNLAVGQYLDAGSTIAKLVQLDNMYVDFEVPEKYISQLKVGNKVVIQSDAYPHTHFDGAVSAMDTSISSETGSITVRANIPNEKHQLLPGSDVNITVYLAQPKKVLAVPYTAVNVSLGLSYVYVLKDNIVKKTKVNVGSEDGQSIFITSGLSPQDKIVSVGSDKLHDGQTVDIENPKNAVNPATEAR